jgi:hypothetical protein
MDAAAHALTRISRDVAERGRPDPEAEEARRFTELLLRAFAVERDVVPIEALYFEGDTQPLTHPISQPQFETPSPLGPLELVSQGEHLCQSADLVAGARSSIERDLRLYHLLGALRSAAAPSTDPVAGALGIFARSTQEALAAGVASSSIEGLVNRLREAGQLLRTVVETDDRMLISRRLLDVAHQMDGLRSAAAEPVPIESLLFQAEPIQEVVPIESLAPDAHLKTEPTSRSTPSGLEASFQTFGRLVKARAATTGSLDTLLSAGGQGRATVTASAGSSAEEPAVAIGTLCYQGQAALERANEVRQQLAARLTDEASLESLQPLLQELLDLVPLALAES